MLLPMRMLVASIALTAAVGGCDRGWQEFQRVELGKPVPADSILRPQKAKDPNAVPTTAPSADSPRRTLLVWSDLGAWPMPMSVGWHAVGVRLDDEGRVTAKSYRAELWSNYLLVTTPAIRRVVELQVPPSVLLEPTDGEVEGYLVGTENCRTLRGYIFNASHEVGSYPVFEQPGSRILGFLSGGNFVTVMMAAGAYHSLETSIQHLPLDGITQPGYDRTFRPVLGGSMRLQNLGQGRIRVEMNFLRLYDPAALAGYLYYVP